MAEKSEAEIVGEVLREAGIPYTVHYGGKHIKVKWSMSGRNLTYTCSKTPSDRRASLNCRARARRMVRRAVTEDRE